MARYPIKMLKDEEGNPFVPLVSTEGIQSPDQRTLTELLGDKLETDNIIPGENVTITTDGNDITISTSGKGVLIDDLNTATAGLGGLDAHQGKVLKEMIPNIVDDVTSTSTTEALSANQGYVLNQKVVPAGGKAGQVLKKKSDASHSLEWGDAADPNAIIGDGSIKKIIEITYEDYKILEDNGQVDPNTEYHIIDGFASQSSFEKMIKDIILATKPIGSIEINTSGINPSIYIGGEWISWGSGQVPVGVNISDTDFATVEKTGGNKTHTHGIGHTHGVPGVAHTHTTGNHTLTVNEMPSHYHSYDDGIRYWSEGTVAGGDIVTEISTTGKRYIHSTTSAGGGGAHNHGNTGSTTPTATTTNSQSTSTSGDASNLQPYITCYMWKRIS